MGNVFKSNEIYKRLKNVSAENNPLRRVRGVYVVGYLKIPKYTTSGILISSVKNIPATVIDMGDTYTHAYQDYVSPAVYDMDKPVVSVTKYGTDSREAYQDYVSPAVYDVDKPVVTVDKYMTSRYTVYQDYVSPAVYDMDKPTVNVDQLTKSQYNTAPDSTLRIRSIISNYATISTI